MSFDITAIGELLIDFTPKGRDGGGLEQYVASPGGAPANVCAVLSKMGGAAAFIGKVGADHFGNVLRTMLTDNHVCVDGLIMDENFKTTLSFVTLGPDGERDFCFFRKNGADTMLRAEEVCLDLIDRSRVLHFGSVSLTDEPCRTAILNTVDYAKRGGAMISYDPNYRPLLWECPALAKEQMLRGLALADLLKISEEELYFLTESKDVAAGAEQLAALGPRVVLVTLGAKGVYFLTPNVKGRLNGYPVKAIDTTGAGDTFMAAFLYEVRSLSLEAICGLPLADFTAIMQRCNAAAAITTTGLGAISAAPDMQAVNRFLSAHASV